MYSEPNLEELEDYHTLKGGKRRVVWAVIIAGLIIGIIYAGAKRYFGKVDDALPAAESIQSIPLQ